MPLASRSASPPEGSSAPALGVAVVVPLARPRPIAVADRVARAFPPRACVVGYRYFAAGSVTVSAAGERFVDALVKGKRVHAVRLRATDGALAASCTCGATSMGPPACRHVWATLLDVDKRGALEALRSSRASLSLTALLDPPAREERAGDAGEAIASKTLNVRKATAKPKVTPPAEAPEARAGKPRGKRKKDAAEAGATRAPASAETPPRSSAKAAGAARGGGRPSRRSPRASAPPPERRETRRQPRRRS